MENKINHLLETSKEVFLNDALENGAIIAGNSDKNYYPKNVVNYRYVWPRDAAYTIYATNALGLYDIQKSFEEWLINRAEGFSETGVLYQRYNTNGARAQRMGDQYQPDQAGTLLWALTAGNSKTDEDHKKIIKLLADGLCKNWGGSCFNIQIYDLWEETNILPNKKSNFTYSLASSAYGLKMAHEMLGVKKWLEASNEMTAEIKKTKLGYYPKIINKSYDTGIDASVLGLMWPFRAFDTDKKLLKSFELIKDKLLKTEGVMRYVGDKYDGMLKHTSFVNNGAGGWPLLTFWYIIGLFEMGRKAEADALFTNYINNFKNYIPEQIFDNKNQTSVSPLDWSHAMFVIACDKLGYLNSSSKKTVSASAEMSK